MNPLLFLVISLTVTLTSPVYATDDSKFAAVQSLLKSLPSCGYTCLATAIAKSPCSPTDITCSCSNTTITTQVTDCIAKSCTVRQQLATKNTTETLCKASIRSRTREVSYTAVIGGVLALVAYLLRMMSKLPRVGGKLGWDDAALTVAIFLATPLTCLSIPVANLGLGKDIWAIPADNITKVLLFYFFDEILYLTALPMIKISVLLFYLRVFQDARFRIRVLAVTGLCFGYGIAFLLVSIFQCQPISLAWNQWDGEHFGTCNDINAQGWSSAALNIILDIVILGMPLPRLAKLNLTLKKKIFVMMMFSVGFFTTIVSILRLRVLIKFGGTKNITWDYVPVGYWSTIEVHVGIICACMPAMRVLLAKFAPKLMSNGSNGIRETTGHGFSNRSGDCPHNLNKGIWQSNDGRGVDDGDSNALVDFEIRIHNTEKTDIESQFKKP